jgi:hypothetical protein
MTNSIDRGQWLNVTSESRDRIYPFFKFYFALGRNRTRDLRVPEPKRTPLGYILYSLRYKLHNKVYCRTRGFRVRRRREEERVRQHVL